MFVFAQEQMAVFAQDLRWRFPGDTFLTDFSRHWTGSLCICGVLSFSGCTSSNKISIRISPLALSLSFIYPPSLISIAAPAYRTWLQYSTSYRFRSPPAHLLSGCAEHALLNNSSEKFVSLFFQGIKHISDGFGRDTTCFSHPLEELLE